MRSNLSSPSGTWLLLVVWICLDWLLYAANAFRKTSQWMMASEFWLWVNAVANTYVSIEIARDNGELTNELHEAYCQDLHRFVDMYPGTLPKWHFIAGHYPMIQRFKIFAPLFDGTYPRETS